MTEYQWLECSYRQRMLEFLRGKVSDRKLRLFAVACCRRLWHLLSNDPSRNAVEVAERLADGLASSAERRAAANAGCHLGWSYGMASCAVGVAAFHAAERTSGNACLLAAEGVRPQFKGGPNPAWRRAANSESSRQIPLVRDIFGNPFRRVVFNPAWRTPDVSNLATAIYEERAGTSGELDPVRLSILTDALEDAGCQDADILGHLRSPGPHVRGCWALDFVLAKE